MKLKEVLDLIQVRDYVATSIGSASLDKLKVHDMARLLPKIDEKIVAILQTDDFRNYVGYIPPVKK